MQCHVIKVILLHLAYIANAKKLCYMKQQSHCFKSARKAYATGRQLHLQHDVNLGVRWCNIILMLERLYEYMQNSPNIAGFLQCKEAEDFKWVFGLYCVRIEIYQL